MTPNEIICGDCLEVMKDWPANSFDAIVTDPPYGLEFMGKDWDKLGAKSCNPSMKARKKMMAREPEAGNPWASERSSYGTPKRNPRCRVCGKQKFNHPKSRCVCELPQWDMEGWHYNYKMQEWHEAWAKEALRIAKPGAFLLCFGGTRTSHRLTCGLEDAGWLIRDKICWIFGSGFPKSTNISLQFDKAACREQLEKELGWKPTKEELKKAWEGFRKVVGKRTDRAATPKRDFRGGKFHVGAKHKNMDLSDITAPATDIAKLWDGYGTALKPAYEDIIVAMKPLDGTFAANAEKWGVVGMNIDGGRIGTSRPATSKHSFTALRRMEGREDLQEPVPDLETNKGRWPANVILDEESARLLDEQSGERPAGGKVTGKQSSRIGDAGIYGHYEAKENSPFYDSGGASRFFYCAKASRAERNAGLEGMVEKQMTLTQTKGRTWNDRCGNCGKKFIGPDNTICHCENPITDKTVYKQKNNHPTVKPLALMEYLCKLLRPPGEHPLLLDPFCGSGTTLIAAYNTGWDWVGIEKEPEYVKIAEKRITKKTEQYSLIEKVVVV